MKITTHFHKKHALMALLLIVVQYRSQAQTNTLINLALNKTATASSLESANFPASSAFDGDTTTRFSSGFNDNAWITVDLMGASLVKNVVLTWQQSYGKDFDILFSNDGSFTDLYADSIQVRNNILSSNTVAGSNTVIMKSNTIARYVRMQGIHRATANGYSLFECRVMGSSAYTNTNFLSASFTGYSVTKLSNSVLIAWTMLIESNSAGYSIERSDDAISFHPVGWVIGQNRGNVPTNYSYLDNQPAIGKNYYRVKQLDLNGVSSYSNVLFINNATSNSVKVYPVPAKEFVAIDYMGTSGEKITVTLSSPAGQPVYSDNMTVTGQQHIVINRTAAMPAGIYFLSINNGSAKPYTQQVFLQ